MGQLFPKTRANGTFKVRVRFTAAPKDISSTQLWLSDWVETHKEWKFLGETRRFGDDFREAPQARLGNRGELCIILEGVSPQRRFWRDWYVRLGREMLEAFPEIGDLAAVENFD